MYVIINKRSTTIRNASEAVNDAYEVPDNQSINQSINLYYAKRQQV